MEKQAFLLSGVPSVQLQVPQDKYDPTLEMNFTEVDGQLKPHVLEGTAPTESKTYQYPADDDPDPDDERCY